jgi:hypothetical protein
MPARGVRQENQAIPTLKMTDRSEINSFFSS